MSEAEPATTPVLLSGPMTLYESAHGRDKIQTALDQGAGVRIDLETAGPWDLAGLQVLAAAVISGRQMGCPVVFAQVPQACVDIAERTGLRDWLAEHTEATLSPSQPHE